MMVETSKINNKPRQLLPDILKGFAVFLIIPLHILETFIDYPGRESHFGKILLFMGGPIVVPVFMMIMGYFSAKSKKPVSEKILRGIKIFFLGFLLNIGLNFHLLLKIQFAGWQFNSLEYIFGVDIFYLAGISLVLIAPFARFKELSGWLALFLALIIAALTATVNNKLMVTERNYILPFIGGTYSWSYFPVFPWLTYPLAGFAFFHFEEKIKAFQKQYPIVSKIILAGIFIGVLYFLKPGFETTVNLSMYYHHTFWYVLWAFGFIVLWAAFIQFLIKQFPKTLAANFFKWLGKNITLFYVIQWLIIGNIATTIYQTQSISSFWYWFTGIFTFTVLLTWLLKKTKIKPAA